MDEALRLAKSYFMEEAIRKYEDAVHVAMACLAGTNYFLNMGRGAPVKEEVCAQSGEHK